MVGLLIISCLLPSFIFVEQSFVLIFLPLFLYYSPHGLEAYGFGVNLVACNVLELNAFKPPFR